MFFFFVYSGAFNGAESQFSQRRFIVQLCSEKFVKEIHTFHLLLKICASIYIQRK